MLRYVMSFADWQVSTAKKHCVGAGIEATGYRFLETKILRSFIIYHYQGPFELKLIDAENGADWCN